MQRAPTGSYSMKEACNAPPQLLQSDLILFVLFIEERTLEHEISNGPVQQ